MQYKRPTIRKRTYGSRVCAVSPYAVGLVADLARALRDARVPPAPQKEWRPSVEYEYIAKHLPEEEGAALIARSEAWFAANPTPVRAAAARPVWTTRPFWHCMPSTPASALLLRRRLLRSALRV